MNTLDIKEEIARKCLSAKLASRKLAVLSADIKKKALIAAAENIDKNRKEIYEAIQNENQKAVNNKTLDLNVLKELFNK